MRKLIFMERIGIIGNGVAGVTVIREIRKVNQTVNLDIFTDESHPYYPRPKLIEYIAGTMDEKSIYQHDFKWYKDNNVELHTCESITKINSKGLTLETSDNSYGPYDRVLYATGSHPWVPPIKGLEKKGMHVLRTIDDAIDIKKAVYGTGREIIVGGGILGIELAAAMKRIGGDPIVISNIDTLLPAQLDSAASTVLVNRLNEMGLEILLNFTCVEIAGDEYVSGVVSKGGDIINGDLVVAATGIAPNTSLAQDCGIICGRGVQVNEYLETSMPGVFAAGDCIEWNGTFLGIIPVALDTARVAAKNMLEPDSASYEGTVPSNTLQVAGIDLTSIGKFAPISHEYESIVSINDEEGTYFKVVVLNDVAVGGIALGSRKFALKLRGLIRNKDPISKIRNTIFDI